MRRFSAATCVVIAGIGCGSNTPPASSANQPSTAVARSHPLTLTFAEPATSYNGPSEQPPSTTLGDLVVRTAREAAASAGRPPPVADERLFMAAAALATVTPENGTVAYPLVEFALQTNGIIEPSPHLLVVWGGLYEPNAAIVRALEPSIARILRAEDITRIGVGAVVRGRFGYGALVVALLSSHVRTAPIPRAIAADGAVELEVGLSPRLSDPRVTVRRTDGSVDAIAPVAKDAGTFTARVECGGAGQMVIELGARNAASFAKFPVWCGMEPPRTFTLTPYLNDVPARSADAERKIMDLVNTERRAMGRRPLVWDDALAKSAREHSEAMRRSGVVAATAPDGVSLRQRVEANRPDHDFAVAVARAYTVAEAHKGVIELPSTRGPLVSSAATMIGIGVAYGQIIAGGMRELFVTEIVAGPNAPMALSGTLPLRPAALSR